MIARINPANRKRAVVRYRLRVILTGTEPPVWRLLEVPGTAKLDWLHAVLQVAIGWTNSHVHRFEVNGVPYSDTRYHYAEFEDEPEILEESKASLAKVAPEQGGAFNYDYDFGDSWRHRIVVAAVLPPSTDGAAQAICLDGARACPPEDCGGIWGYANLLEVLKDPKHPEHRTLKRWVGRSFNPDAFNVGKANTWLGGLKWPHVSDSQLRKVLMRRDGYHE